MTGDLSQPTSPSTTTSVPTPDVAQPSTPQPSTPQPSTPQPSTPEPPTQPDEPISHYRAMGGHRTFTALVEHFYAGVADDELLRPMYPEADLGPAADRLRMFLEQYWGGPTAYHEQRGHPRLRLRHQPFVITEAARDRWLHHMLAAVDRVQADESLRMPDEYDHALRTYLTRAAQSLVNTYDQGVHQPGLNLI